MLDKLAIGQRWNNTDGDKEGDERGVGETRWTKLRKFFEICRSTQTDLSRTRNRSLRNFQDRHYLPRWHHQTLERWYPALLQS